MLTSKEKKWFPMSENKSWEAESKELSAIVMQAMPV